MITALVGLAFALLVASCAEGGEETEEIQPEGSDCQDPVFSADGNEIVFSCDTDGDSGIYSYTLASRELQRLIAPSAGDLFVTPGPRMTGGWFTYQYCPAGDRNGCQIRMTGTEGEDRRLSPETIDD